MKIDCVIHKRLAVYAFADENFREKKLIKTPRTKMPIKSSPVFVPTIIDHRQGLQPSLHS